MKTIFSAVLCFLILISTVNVNVFAEKFSKSTGIVYTTVSDGKNSWLITSNKGGLFSDEDIIEGTVTFSQYIFNESDEELSFRLALQLDDGGWTIPDNSQSKNYTIAKNSGAWVEVSAKVNENNKVKTAKGEFDVSKIFLRFDFIGDVLKNTKFVLACDEDMLKKLDKGIHAQNSMFKKELTNDDKYKVYPEKTENTINADFRISGAFSDNMVIQRDKTVRIWGFSTYIGKEVVLSFNGQKKTTTVENDGTWTVKLDKMSANSVAQNMDIACNGKSVTLTNILIGDVFFIGGQSNAEKELGRCGNEYSTEYKKELIASGNGNIRYFTQHRNDTLVDKSVWNTPQAEPINSNKWVVESLGTADQFSAIGFFFAHKMYDSLNVPIGMIMVAANGAALWQLMSDDAATKANYRITQGEIPTSAMYNALMNPFIKMSVKGMLFYHGENERGLAVSNYGKYNEYLKIYIDDLRAKNGDDFSLYSVQLTSHPTEDWKGTEEQRAVQFDGIKMIKNAGLVVSVDYGVRSTDDDAGHPNYKEPIGKRLADLALNMDYGIGDPNYVLSPEPLYAEKTDEGIIIKYKNVGDGLKRLGQHDKLSGFRIISDNKYEEVSAQIISKDTILLDAKEFLNIEGVAYGIEQLAFVDYPEGNGDLKYVANLGNSADLPSPTFKIKSDDFKKETPNTDFIQTDDIHNENNESVNNADKKMSATIWLTIGVGVIILAVIVFFLVKRKL